ncbi:metal ABC transporter ATP-binding protein [Schaalia sp. ZJ1691]|uniref:metal ABC transporter ATP-binding protein n=1 Tax=Schaalia sp. ZJ1691 TaxID=2709404 RepID=UPI001F14B9DA|nr:metal ABC transporter ATP-binding protein [Schaalia sp. ZJ1691]
MTHTDVISVDNLHVAWDTNLILHGVSLRVPRGSVVALTGSNGSGKSTLLRAILGSAPITRGSVELFGCALTHPRSFPWKRIGYVPQRVATPGGVTSSSIEVVRTGLLGPSRWWPAPKDRQRSLDALQRVGMAHRAKDPMSILSGGQQQRVLIARALVRSPELLIMDEPMAGIDAASRRRLAGIVSDLRAAGTTILVVLHELGELAPSIDRELHIGSGHITYDGPPRLSTEHAHTDDTCHTHSTSTAPIGARASTLVTEIYGGNA